MSTGNVTSWDGNIADVGPIYPFVGWEGLMVVLCIVFWVAWHVWQIRIESRRLASEAERLGQAGNLQQAVADEHSLQRM